MLLLKMCIASRYHFLKFMHMCIYKCMYECMYVSLYILFIFGVHGELGDSSR